MDVQGDFLQLPHGTTTAMSKSVSNLKDFMFAAAAGTVLNKILGFNSSITYPFDVHNVLFRVKKRGDWQLLSSRIQRQERNKTHEKKG